MAKFCPSCGKPNDDAAGFCSSCGGAFPAQAAPSPAPPSPVSPPFAGPYAASGAPPFGVPPAGPAATAPGGGSRTPLIILIVVLVAAAIAVACYFLFLRDSGDKGTSSNPSPSASASPTATATATVSRSPTATAAGGQTCAAVQGVKANIIGAFDFEGGFVEYVSGNKPLEDLSWSPDGRRLAYRQLKKQWSWESTLMVYDVAGGSAKAVSFGSLVPEVNYGFTWVSPTKIVASVFETVPKKIKSNGRLYLCDVAAGTAEPLKDADGNALKGINPSASADGTLLVFDSFGPGTSGTSVTEKLQRLDVEKGIVKTVASAQVDTMIEGLNFNYPLLSPDGTQIFTEQTGSDIGFSVTIYASTGAVTYKSDYLLYPTGAAWDPSGSGRLVFGARKRDPGPAFILMFDPKADGLVTVAKVGKKYLLDFAWSPDGATIYYTVMNPANDYRTDDMWLVRSNGSGRKLFDRETGSPAVKKGGLEPTGEGSSPTPAPSSTP